MMATPCIQCDKCEKKFATSENVTVLELRDLARKVGWTGPMDSFPPSISRPPDLCPTCQGHGLLS